VLGSLKLSGFIKENSKRIKWKITFQGHLFRIVCHPLFPLFALLFSALVAYSIFILNRSLSSRKEQKQENNSTKLPPSDSFRRKSFQIPAKKDSAIPELNR